MVDETNSQVNNATIAPAEDEYEYEYIELAEGEELPEGAEYEYEYVEVPVEDEGQEGVQVFSEEENVSSQTTDAVSEEQNSLPQENIPQFLQNDTDTVAEKVVYEPVEEPFDSQGEIVEEPHFKIETPSGEWKEDENLPKFEELAEDNQVEDLKMPDFLSEPRSESAHLDEILDDDSPLPNVNSQHEDEAFDDEFEKELFGTPAPDLHLDDVEENTQKLGSSLAEQNVEDFSIELQAGEKDIAELRSEETVAKQENYSEQLESEPVMAEDVAPAPEPMVEPVMAEEIEPEPEPVVESVVAEDVAPAPEPVAEPEVVEDVAPAPEPVAEPVMVEEVAPAPEPVAEPEVVEDVAPAPEPVVEPVMVEEVVPAPEPMVEPVMVEEVAPAPEPMVEPVMAEEVVPAPEPVAEPVMVEEVAPAPEPVAEPVMVEDVAPAPEPMVEPVMAEEVVSAPEPVAEPVMVEEVAPAPEPVVEPVVREQVVQEQKVQIASNEEQPSVREEIVSVQSKNDLPQSQDYQAPSQESVVKSDSVAKDEQVSVSGLVEENVPVITAPVAPAPVAEPTPAPVFQQTEEIPVEIKVYDMSDDEYQSLCSVAFPFNKNSGFRGFQADEKVYNLVVEDIDYNLHEENEWSLIIFDDYRVRLNPNEKELVLPKGDNTVRYAKIMKSGKTKLELFNEEKYNFMAPTEDFVKIRGHYIYGNIANNSKLIVKDFVNISLGDKLGKQITFNKPVSGLLTGPKASKLYFSDVRSAIVPSAKQMHQDEEKERSKAARWYSGSSDDKCFEFDAKSQILEFVGNDECKIIHVNVGISHYGWNITFSNGLFMSFRDLLEYQTRYGQLPDNSGVITHGQQTLKFANVEKIIIYEAAQYFTYG